LDFRRIALRGLVTVPLVVTGGLGFWYWLPRLAQDRIVGEVRERTGLEARVSETTVSFGAVSLTGFSLHGKEARSLLAVESLRVEGNPISVALRGAGGIEAISVRGISASLRVDGDDEQRLLRRVGARGASVQAAGGSARRWPRISLRGLALDVSDGHGELLALKASSVSVAGQEARLEIERARLGAEELSHGVVENVSAEFERTADGTRLQELTIGGATLWIEPAARGEEIAGAPTAAQDAQQVEDAASDPPPRLLARLLDVGRRLLAQPEPGAGKADAGGGAGFTEPGEGAGLLNRIGEGASLQLEDAQVRELGAGTAMVEGLGVRARKQSSREIVVEGEGRAQGSGVLGWKLSLIPSELRADGTLTMGRVPLSLLIPVLPSIPWHRPEQSWIDATLDVKAASASRLAVSGDLSVLDAAIFSPRIAPEPVQKISLHVQGKGHFLPLQKRLQIDEGTLRFGAAVATIHGALEHSAEHFLIDLDAKMAPTPCNEALRSIPEPLLGDLKHASWRGNIGASLRTKIDTRDLASTELEMDIADACEFLTVPALADLRRFQFAFLHSVLEPDGTVFELETGPGTPAWTYLEDISPFFVRAVLAHEDARFFGHRGFSPPHIRNALVRNLEAGRYVVGASTITMQLVKNVFLHREKTLARKIQEVLLTWWIERVMPKRDILELYLNVIEYGPGVYGIRNGAKYYFNRLPAQLSPAESIYLATILPNPKRAQLHVERGSPPEGHLERMRKMVARMRARGWYDARASDYALAELARFRFVPEGTPTEVRDIQGGTAPLPYQRVEEAGWDDFGADDGSEFETGAPVQKPSGGPAAEAASAPVLAP